MFNPRKIGVFALAAALSASFCLAEDNHYSNSANVPQEKTGITDGQKTTKSGTNVIAGEEANKSGPESGVGHTLKNKRMRKRRTHAHTETQSR